jgi:GntR family transcriptional regulator
VAALRSAGLVETAHGRATLVRAIPGDDAARFDTTITRTGHTWNTWDAGWEDAEPAARYRTQTAADAVTLGVNAAEPVFVADRLLRHPSGALAAHRLVVPFATVNDVPALIADLVRPAALYAALTDAGHELRWDDTLRATMPTPDDAATLHLPDGVPLLTHTRTTHSTEGDRPLTLEITRLPADGITITSHQQLTAENQRRG